VCVCVRACVRPYWFIYTVQNVEECCFGETVQSKGYHEMNIVSWFLTMRIVDWTIWKDVPAITAFVLYFIVSGIHPAAVKCPVSASLVGRSSHVKLFVRSIARSILCFRNLRQRNQTVISGSWNVWKQSKDSRLLWISRVVRFWATKFFANKILKTEC
jgi:hypothetical protein